METNAVVARWDDAQQRMEVWAGTQSPFFVRKELAHILGLDRTQVRVHAIEIGGGFGGKSQAPEPIRTQVAAEVGRNAEGRLRVLSMAAELHLGVPAAQLEHLQRVLDTFEQYCTVTQSVGQGIPVAVRVLDTDGRVLKG